MLPKTHLNMNLHWQQPHSVFVQQQLRSNQFRFQSENTHYTHCIRLMVSNRLNENNKKFRWIEFEYRSGFNDSDPIKRMLKMANMPFPL